MITIKTINLAVRFLLELCILIIFCYWGFKTGVQTSTKILLGLGSPVLFALIWGVFLAPKSALRAPEPWLFVLEFAVFALASWALYSTGKSTLTATFALIYVLNKFLMVVWGQ